MKFLTILFLFSIFSLHSYELSICTIFKDDSKYLPEWIEFHQKQGVEHFYLYDNNSQDNPIEYLISYIEKGLVTLTTWNHSHDNQDQWNLIQCNAYMDCIGKIKDHWCAFIDTDEFLFSPTGIKLSKLLKDYDEYSSILVYWRCYGTSSVEKIPENEKLVNVLVYRAKSDHPWNNFVKNILQPKYVSGCFNPHTFEFFEKPILDLKKNVFIFRINHYWSRDKEFFFKEKIARRLKWDMDYQKMIKTESEMNEIYDPILNQLQKYDVLDYPYNY